MPLPTDAIAPTGYAPFSKDNPLDAKVYSFLSYAQGGQKVSIERRISKLFRKPQLAAIRAVAEALVTRQSVDDSVAAIEDVLTDLAGDIGGDSVAGAITDLNAVVADLEDGETATATKLLVRAQDTSPGDVTAVGELGGVRPVDNTNIINRATTQADIDYVVALLTNRFGPVIPTGYPVDLSGNGGGGKVGTHSS